MHRPSPARSLVLSLSLCALLGVACEQKPDKGTAPVASTLAPSLPTDAATQALTFVIDPASTSSIDMPGKDEHIKAKTSAATGSLSVDPSALGNTRGEIKIDLATLTTKTFDDPKRDGEQTTHARTWLEAVVDGKVQEPYRYAVLAVRSVEIVGEAALDKLPLGKVDGADVRHAKAVVHGDLLVHGHKVERAVPVGLDFSYASPTAPANAPIALRIRTEKPMAITLKDHEVMPRDPVGKLLKWTSELTNRVATEANVDVDLKATTAPR